MLYKKNIASLSSECLLSTYSASLRNHTFFFSSLDERIKHLKKTSPLLRRAECTDNLYSFYRLSSSIPFQDFPTPSAISTTQHLQPLPAVYSSSAHSHLSSNSLLFQHHHKHSTTLTPIPVSGIRSLPSLFLASSTHFSILTALPSSISLPASSSSPSSSSLSTSLALSSIFIPFQYLPLPSIFSPFQNQSSISSAFQSLHSSPTPSHLALRGEPGRPEGRQVVEGGATESHPTQVLSHGWRDLKART